MSYSRSYRETITVRGSESKVVSYPKSESGGSMTVTVHYTEEVPVNIDIHVDTSPFDQSINSANNHVNLLTGSVVATQAAHIAAKVRSAEDISTSVVDGFFGLIRSEINQQLTELKPKVESLLIGMQQYQESCVAKKSQLESDFGRITERYSRIFNDLDKELRNRILMLNKSAVAFHGELSSRVHRSFADVSSGIATVHNREGSALQSVIFASGMKRRAAELIESGKKYLFSERKLSAQLEQILSPEAVGSVTAKKIPVVYMEARSSSGTSDVRVIAPDQIPGMAAGKAKLKDGFLDAGVSWASLSAAHREQIRTYLNRELAADEAAGKGMSPRVAAQMMRLWEQNSGLQSNIQ